MCDTQVMITPEAVWLAKNSDREPSEPQWVERIPAVSGDDEELLACTHITIPQVPDRHGLLLSRPSWIWGAEIGINDQGVSIGNEAIFSRSASLAPGLLGMDLLRLGLERGASARQALDVITRLLAEHGQGGPAGYRDKGFHYDNSFLIADAQEAWVLETSGREWAAKQVSSHYAISNALTLEQDFDLASDAVNSDDRGFRQRHDTRMMPWFAGARARRQLGLDCLADSRRKASFQRFFSHLRRHAHQHDDPGKGSNADVCLHARGLIRRSQTTGSMVVRLSDEGIRAFFTGSSAPCLSLFRPAGFEAIDYSVLHNAGQPDSLWRRQERLHRRALYDHELRSRMRADNAETEAAMLDTLSAGNWSDEALRQADVLARHWDRRRDADRAIIGVPPPLTPGGLYWRTLNRRDGI